MRTQVSDKDAIDFAIQPALCEDAAVFLKDYRSGRATKHWPEFYEWAAGRDRLGPIESRTFWTTASLSEFKGDRVSAKVQLALMRLGIENSTELSAITWRDVRESREFGRRSEARLRELCA